MTPPIVKPRLPREEPEWTTISDGMRGYTQVMQVPDGLLYRTVVYGAVGLCFAPSSPGPPLNRVTPLEEPTPNPPPDVTP